MKSVRTTTVAEKEKTVTKPYSLFDRDNLLWMGVGAVVLALGFILMAGGRSDDPNVFNANEVYSTVRITIAPILILAGFVIEIFAIFRHPKNH